MYSMVMMMAMSGTAALPAHGGNGGCHGGYACSGNYACSGYGCNGCKGGGHRLFGGLFNHGSKGCHGGYGCSGSYGCSGCHGTVKASYGCSGSYGCNGCHGGGHRLFGKRGHGCNGSACSGYRNCCGTVVVGCTGCTGAPMGAPAGAAPQAAPAPAEKRAEPRPPAASNAPAKLLVSLPADAALTIDGQATTSTGTTREFASPVLEAGRDYVYTLKAVTTREGKPVEESQTIRVRAGETTPVSFGLTSVAAN